MKLEIYKVIKILIVVHRGLILGRTSKVAPPPHTPTVVQGGGGVYGAPSWRFWYVAVFRNHFTFSRKPLIFLTRWDIFYGWWCSFKSINVVTFLSRVIRNLGHGLLVLSIQFQTTGPLNRRLFVPNFSRYFHQRPVASWVHDFYMLRQPIYHVFFLKHINN